MTKINLFLIISSFILVFFNSAGCSEVPAIFWNIKGASFKAQPVSAFDTGVEGLADIFDGSLKDGSTGLVVFMIDKLSMEDLALQPYYEDSNSTVKLLQSFLEDQPFTIYPNMKDPAKSMKKSKCGVEDIYVTANMEGRLLKAISSALEQSCVVVVHLPHSSSLADSKLLFNSDIFLPTLKISKKNIIGLFTAKKSSWESTDGSSRKTRGLLQLEELQDSNPYFLNVSGCALMYAKNATLIVGNPENGTFPLSLPPAAFADCDKNETELTLTFNESGKISEVILKFEFSQNSVSWGSTNISVEIKGESSLSGIAYMVNSIDGPNRFSYSCGNLELRNMDKDYPVALFLESFQIEVYDIGEMFAKSVNCVTWFTLPIWMGSFIVLLFLTILNCGVYFLFQAKTMDRFDDPKGKTITVPQTD